MAGAGAERPTRRNSAFGPEERSTVEPTARSSGEDDRPFGPGTSVRAVGHRGAAAVAPENTLPGFRHAVEVGADGVELDVQCSRDGELMVIHDDTVDRTTDGEGAVEAMDRTRLRSLDAGYAFTPDRGRSHPYRGRGVRIPTLEEVAEGTGDLALIVEVKSARAGRVLAEWLREEGARHRDRIAVGGFEPEQVRPAAREARWRSAYQGELLPFVLLGKVGLAGLVEAPDADAAMVPEKRWGIRVVSSGFCRRAHRAGMGVFVWTVNRPDRARRLLDRGVDGLVSDAPGRILRLLDERRAEGAEGPDRSDRPGG